MGNLASRWISRTGTITQDNETSGGLTKEKNNSRFYNIETRAQIFVPKLCLMLRTGRRVYIPYAHQPLIDYSPERDLQIVTHRIKVTIKGRGLEPIVEALFDDRVRWIRESNVRFDTREEDTFIASIQIDSDMLD